MSKYKLGAIVREVSPGAEKWYKMCGWKKIESKKEVKKNDKTDSKKTPSA